MAEGEGAAQNSSIPNGLTVQERSNYIAKVRAERVRRHQEAVKKIFPSGSVPGVSLPPASVAQPLNIFADGDSWFDYPLPTPLTPSDVIAQIKMLGDPSPLILNLAHHGDTATAVLGIAQRKRMIEKLSDPNNGKFDAILMSAGGNDIAGEQFCLWLNKYQNGFSPADGLDMARLRHILGVVESAFIDLIDIRDSLPMYGADDKPVIFMHGYDFPWPDGSNVCGVGPWLQPSLQYRKWTDIPTGAQIVKQVLLELDKLLSSLEQRFPKVVYVKTQGTLGYGNAQWANELHPNPNGFKQIAAKFVVALRNVFPGKI